MINKTPSFLLYGIGGVYNYGCEAIVRGTVNLLRTRWPEANITLVTPRYEDDMQRLNDININIIRKMFEPRFAPKRIARKAAGLLSIHWDPFVEKIDYMDEVDVVLSIGGDMYTVSPLGAGYAKKLIQFGDIAINKNKKLVIWGASIGPFEDNTDAKKAYVKHLQNVDLITAREPITVNYLNKLGLSQKTVSCSDPAFIVSGSTIRKPPNNKRLHIGVNYSPLSLLFATKNENLKNFAEKQSLILCKLIEKYNSEITLIPHVVCSFEPTDDDYTYLMSIRTMIPEKFKDRIHIIDNDPGYIGLKDVLESCDIVIAARMHCAINAISLGIPTIFVSYSAKSEGMAQYIYNHNVWVVSLNDTTSVNLVQKVQMMINEKEKVQNQLLQKIQILKKDATKSVNALEKILEGPLN
ncbi:MAG: polysaccharide pyruvyl transferase family protein [Proteobacteria bacterium]|nr:polysaccharide pyruvyl transferase family protein [Pseudomonadota bacterium]